MLMGNVFSGIIRHFHFVMEYSASSHSLLVDNLTLCLPPVINFREQCCTPLNSSFCPKQILVDYRFELQNNISPVTITKGGVYHLFLLFSLSSILFLTYRCKRRMRHSQVEEQNIEEETNQEIEPSKSPSCSSTSDIPSTINSNDIQNDSNTSNSSIILDNTNSPHISDIQDPSDTPNRPQSLTLPTTSTPVNNSHPSSPDESSLSSSIIILDMPDTPNSSDERSDNFYENNVSDKEDFVEYNEPTPPITPTSSSASDSSFTKISEDVEETST